MGAEKGSGVIEFLREVAAWFAYPANWTGNRGLPGGIPRQMMSNHATLRGKCVITLR